MTLPKLKEEKRKTTWQIRKVLGRKERTTRQRRKMLGREEKKYAAEKKKLLDTARVCISEELVTHIVLVGSDRK